MHRLHDLSVGATSAAQSRVAQLDGIHPPQRSGRAGPGGQEARVAGGQPSTHSLTTTTDPAPGLVPSATTARGASRLAGLDGRVLCPSVGDVVGAARAFGPAPWSDLGRESPLSRWYITPGALIGTRKSARQIVREQEQEQVRRIARVNVVGRFLAEDENWRLKSTPGREVTEWSRKSRVNMVRVLASVDWGPVHDLADAGRLPAMVTLTYPADWETVAGDGKEVKRHVRVWKERYRRAWGEPVVGAWKLEFQARGAPHVHIFMAPPHGVARGGGVGAGLRFHHWLSAVWADVVNHPDSAEYMKHLAAGTAVDFKEAHKVTDPRRLASYFGKHGQWRSKEYQHNVPECWQAPGKGPGRFWGYWGLKVLRVAVEMTGEDFQLATRIMRRWSERVRVWDDDRQRWAYVRAMAPGKARWRDVDRVTGEVIWRKRRRRSRSRRFGSGAGFVIVNDAPAMARQLARAIEVCGVRQ